jgi:hypothetical protein
LVPLARVFLKDLNPFAPPLLRHLIKLTPIEHRVLNNAIAPAATVLNATPIAGLLTGFEAVGGAQKQAISVAKTTANSIGEVFTTNPFQGERVEKSAAYNRQTGKIR